jgi:hypothetical protein
MSSRFHQKYHRYNHHSVPPGTGDSVAYPDEGYDPIASFDSPFQGEFYTTGDVIGRALSANEGLFSGTTGYINQSLTVGTQLSVGGTLTVGTNAIIWGDLTVYGNYTTLDTRVYSTSALEITNTGTGPALKITQTGITPLAQFIDAEGSEIIFDNNSYVGIGTGTPESDIHIKRQGFQSEVKVEGSRAILTLATNIEPDRDFSISKEESNLVIFSTQSYGTPNEELYKFKNRDDLNIITVLSSGKVGINNALQRPNKELTVFGDISATKGLYVPRIGVNVDTANKELTVKGEISASETIFVKNATVHLNANIGETLFAKNATITQTLYASAVGIGTPTPNHRLTVSGNLSCGGLYIPTTTSIVPAVNTVLPLVNDIIFNNHTTSVVVTAFSNGFPNVTYTLTNKSANSVFLRSSPRLYVRGPSWLTKAWRYFKCTPDFNPWHSWANFRCTGIIPEIEIPQNFSCTLRMHDSTTGAIW